ncbi:MAG TPA: hypothetical protein VGV40_10630, partial [Solirubrobacteraceae bacterium]|nr:hypothetical protein [Solirubrobacteraceae bacterium]
MTALHLAPGRPNVELRAAPGGGREVVLAFPYRADVVEAARGIPGRRFDWDRREWWAPVDEWVALHVAAILERFPELEPSDEVMAWLDDSERRWLGVVSTARHDGRGWFV